VSIYQQEPEANSDDVFRFAVAIFTPSRKNSLSLAVSYVYGGG